MINEESIQEYRICDNLQLHHILSLISVVAKAFRLVGETTQPDFLSVIREQLSRSANYYSQLNESKCAVLGLPLDYSNQIVGNSDSDIFNNVENMHSLIQDIMSEYDINDMIQLDYNPDRICNSCAVKRHFKKWYIADHCADVSKYYLWDEATESFYPPMEYRNSNDENLKVFNMLADLLNPEIINLFNYSEELTNLLLDDNLIIDLPRKTVLIRVNAIRNKFFWKAICDYSNYLHIKDNPYYIEKMKFRGTNLINTSISTILFGN